MQARCVREDAKQALTGLSPSLAALGERSVSPLMDNFLLCDSCIPMLRDMSGAFRVPVENDQLRAGVLGDQPVLWMESVE